MLRCIETQWIGEGRVQEVLALILRVCGLRSQGIILVDGAGIIVKPCHFYSLRLSCGKFGYIVEKLCLRARVSTRGARAALDVRRARRAPLR